MSRPPWTIQPMLRENRHALTVLGVLRGLARGSRQLSPLREEVASIAGLSERIVGDAIAALHKGHWINRQYGREGLKTWYRITLPEVCWSPVCRKSTPRARTKMSKNSTQGKFPCMSKNDILPPKGGRGVPKRRRPPADAGASTGRPKETRAPKQTTEEHPAQRAERKTLEAIRTKREAREQEQDGETETESGTEARPSVA